MSYPRLPKLGEWNAYLLTLNESAMRCNPQDKMIDLLTGKLKAKYFCMSEEVNTMGKHHLHIYFVLETPLTFEVIRSHFIGAHIDKCLGTPQQNRDYVAKEGKWALTDKASEERKVDGSFIEWGVIPSSHYNDGKKYGIDFDNLYALIKGGATDYEIIEADPNYIGQLQHISMVRKILKNESLKQEQAQY